MNDSMHHNLSAYLDNVQNRLRQEESRLSELSKFCEFRLKINQDKLGNCYYSVYSRSNATPRYVGTADNDNIQMIKEAHFLKRSVRELKREERAIKKLLHNSMPLDYESLNGIVPKAYRDAKVLGTLPQAPSSDDWLASSLSYKSTFGPFREDELIHKTRDGNLVRSKGEALIYNYLLELGVTFVYELPLKIRHSGYSNSGNLLLPDFTILSELDYSSVIYLEHQGMMSNERYRSKFNETVYKYWANNLLPERDVFFTFDLPNGGFDDSPIRNIINGYIRPSS